MYLAVFILTALINYLTLFLVAQRTKTGIRVLHSSKAFLVGDFFLIPLYFTLLYAFTNGFILFQRIPNPVVLLMASLAVTIIVGFGVKFKLLSLLWVPHGIFAWAVVLSFLLVSYLVLIKGTGDWIEWVVLLLLLLMHQFGASRLGSKRLPLSLMLLL